MLRSSPAIALALALAASMGGCADVRPPQPETATRDWDRSVDPAADAPPVLTRAGAAPVAAPVAKAQAPGAATSVARPAAHLAPVPDLASSSPAMRLAELSDADCLVELRRLGLPFEKSAQAAVGVATPLRLDGPLRGVKFVTPAAPSTHGVFDCRLALATDALAEVLASHRVVEVRVDNTYRKGAHLPGRATKSQHASGLAMDLMNLKLADGRTLAVPSDWHAPIGSTPCGPEATLNDPNPQALELRKIVCDVARRGIFHHMLTPSFNAAHQSHFHFDLKRGDTRLYLR